MTQIKKKNTFLFSHAPGTGLHLHIVLTDPFGKPERVFIVNLCSYNGKHYEDETVIIKKDEHAFVKHDSYVAYDYAKRTKVDVILKLFADGKAIIKDDITQALHDRITIGLLKSERTPSDIKSLYRRFFVDK